MHAPRASASPLQIEWWNKGGWGGIRNLVDSERKLFYVACALSPRRRNSLPIALASGSAPELFYF